MTVLAIVGGHDREEIQAFLNDLIPKGGVTEVRLLQLGSTEYFNVLAMEQCLVHDVEKFFVVNLKDLFIRDGKNTEVIVFMNSSYKSLPDFCAIAFPLVKIVFDEMLQTELRSMKILFGDNYRGLLQKCYLDKISSHIETPLDLHSVAISSIYQISKSLNSVENSGLFRLYPKVDGGIYAYDPSNALSEEDLTSLSKELEQKLGLMEKVFSNKSASSYPNIEGNVLSNFMEVYFQRDWDIACRDAELHSRCPTNEEVTMLGLSSNIAVFLPLEDSDERLPELVKKHVKQASEFVFSVINNTDD